MQTAPETRKNDLLTRLRRIEGQVQGLQRMIEQDRPAEDLLTQTAAALAALRKVYGLSFALELHRLLNSSAEEASDELARLLERFGQMS